MHSLLAPSRQYQPRLLDSAIDDLFGRLPAVMITGPRAAGKTTTAARHVASIVRLDRLAGGTPPSLPSDPPDLRGYVDLILQSGFPEPALHMSPRARTRWLESYVEQLLTVDAIELDPRRYPARLRRFFEAYALNTAGIVSDAALLRAAGINRRTALAYKRLLTNLFVVEAVPSWSSNRLRRLSRGPKRYFIDPALVASVSRLDARSVLRDGDLLDLFAFEVKADAAPGARDARHLACLRDRLDERFLRGVVFHTGPGAFELSERISDIPICALWG